MLELTPTDLELVLAEVEEKLWEVKGFSLDIKANNEEAVAHLEKYLELDPDGPQAATASGIVETLTEQTPQDPG